MATGRLGRIRRRAEGRTGQTGVYFTQPPRRTPFARVLVPGSGVTKQKKMHFNTPAPTQHHRAKRTTTNNGTRRRRFCPAAGRSARFASRSKHAQVHARECRSAAAGRTHCRLVVGRSVSDAYATAADSSHVPLRRYQTAFARLTKSRRTSRSIDKRDAIIKLYPASILLMTNLLNAELCQGSRNSPPPGIHQVSHAGRPA